MEKTKYTREQIAERIIDHGDLLVIYMNKIYRLNAWIKHHPGGEMVILHMVGKVRTNTLAARDPFDLFRMPPMKSMPIIRTMSYARRCRCFTSATSTAVRKELISRSIPRSISMPIETI